MKHHTRPLFFILLIVFSLLSACAPETPQGIRDASTDICVWQQLSWDQMSTDEHALWSHLGWNIVKWESQNPATRPNLSNKSWGDLSYVEKITAESLGYTQQNWDNPTCGD